ncbi:MAG: hypothetical protein AAGG01_12875, partial [Planctomycetota bacterium]
MSPQPSGWANPSAPHGFSSADSPAETVAPLERDAELQRAAAELPVHGEEARQEAERAARAPLQDEHGESSLQARTACTVFLTAFVVVLAVVAVFMRSERSALRIADADLFCALGDQSAQAIIAHVDSADGDLSGRAFEAVHAEVCLLAETKGVRQV